MSISIAQVKAQMLCTKGTLRLTPSNIVYIGNRASGGKLTIEDTEMVSDYMEREHRNKINIKSEFTSLQIGAEEFITLIDHIKTNMGVDTQIVTTLEEGNTSSQGIFDLTGDNFVGLDLELVRSSKEASTKIICESSYDYGTGIEVISAAATNVANTGLLATTGKAGIDFSKMLYPNIEKITLGAAVSEVFPLLVPRTEIKDWKFSIKTKGEKNMYNKTIANMVTVELECEIMDASISKIEGLLEKEQNSRIGIDIFRKGNTTWETWVFNMLPFKVSADKNDKTSTVKVSAKGNVYLDDITFDFTTSLGGNAKVITFN